ncbi:unnamed protein product [Closterium sp. NIES-53]
MNALRRCRRFSASLLQHANRHFPLNPWPPRLTPLPRFPPPSNTPLVSPSLLLESIQQSSPSLLEISGVMASRSSLAMAASSLSNPSGFSGISSSSMIIPSPLPRATSALSFSLLSRRTDPLSGFPELQVSPATCDSRSMVSATASCRINKSSLIGTQFGQSSPQLPSQSFILPVRSLQSRQQHSQPRRLPHAGAYNDGNQPGYPYSFTRVPSEASFSADGSWPDNYRVWENGGGLVHVEAVVDSSAVIEPSAVVHSEARIGAKTRIGSGSVVGPYVKIGAETVIWYNVSLTNCTIGDRCVFHNGVQIGQDGFGFFVDESGNMVKKPQTLGVQIGSDVEMGANTCVDRGSWRDTQIGDFVKIDNLVQIGHNVVIGRCCIICGQTGIGGSSTLGDYVVLAGQVGVADHVTIADKVRVAAKSGVASDIKEPGDYAGFPTVKASEWRRLVVMERRMMKGTDRSAPSANPTGRLGKTCPRAPAVIWGGVPH